MSIDIGKLENVRQRGGKVTARCPACGEAGADRSGEHLVILDGGKWGCIANTGDAGKEHRRRIAAIAGMDATATPRPFIPRPTAKPTCKPAKPLPPLRTPTIEELHLIAVSRGHSADGMEILVERGMLFTADVWDDGKTWPAWVATDPTRANAQARKIDRDLWWGIGGKKPKSLTPAARCIGASIIGDRPEVWLVEGTPDLIAAPVAAKRAGLDLDQIAFVCVTGAGNSLHADDLHCFSGKRVTVAMHADGAGAEAANRWAAQLYQAGAREVVGFDFTGTGKDLSDYLKSLPATVTTDAPPSLPEAKQSTPKGLCPTCWNRRIIAPTNGPTCACKPYVWPVWTPAQIEADTKVLGGSSRGRS